MPCALMTWRQSECCVPSGLDFEATSGSVVHYVQLFVSKASSRYKHDVWSFMVKCGNTQKSTHILFSILVRCSAHGHSFVRLRYNSYNLQCSIFIHGIAEHSSHKNTSEVV